MTDTVPATDTGLLIANNPRVFPQFTAANVVAFPKVHRQRDPLIRDNLEHAFIAIHFAAQFDEDRRDAFVQQLIAEDKAGDIADILNNNARAIRWLMCSIDFMMARDTAIAEAADRFLTNALVGEA